MSCEGLDLAAKRLGIDYETYEINQHHLVPLRVTAGWTYRDLVGHDINYISQGGAVDIMSQPGIHPPSRQPHRGHGC
jgi:crotonobetainyl-CoA:carnitine CoA-transferase CaiB-like acyl-CoA transferase